MRTILINETFLGILRQQKESIRKISQLIAGNQIDKELHTIEQIATFIESNGGDLSKTLQEKLCPSQKEQVFYKEQVKRLVKERITLQNEIKESKQRESELQERINELAGELENCKTNYSKLKEKVEKSLSNVSGHGSILEKSQHENSPEQLRGLTSVDENSTRYLELIGNLKNSNKELQKEATRWSNLSKQMEDQLNIYRSSLNSINDMQIRAASSENERISLQSENDQLRERKESLEQQNASILSELGVKSVQINELQKSLNELKDFNIKLEETIVKNQQKLE